LNNYNCIVVLGPTASGKTRLACRIAIALNGEVISADSRQVYKYLDIGTGKDLDEYEIDGKQIPYHLINIAEPQEQFYLHGFMQALKVSFESITNRGRLPVICGGTGLYLDALRKDFSYTQIKENASLRKELDVLPKDVLVAKLNEYPDEWVRHVDHDSKKRLIRGIEVAQYMSENALTAGEPLPYKPLYIGIAPGLEERKKRISERLTRRLNVGLIEEVEALLQRGLTHERLQMLGLEYKYISYYLLGKITREELFSQLQTAIFQFAKRQMTWFRKMEKEGVLIHWLHPDYKLQDVLNYLLETSV
jgi:tRNA dimethylallyltransferase